MYMDLLCSAVLCVEILEIGVVGWRPCMLIMGRYNRGMSQFQEPCIVIIWMWTISYGQTIRFEEDA